MFVHRERFDRTVKTVDIASQFRLERPYIVVPSFVRYGSYKLPVSAMDVALAISALLEACNTTAPTGGGSDVKVRGVCLCGEGEGS